MAGMQRVTHPYAVDRCFARASSGIGGGRTVPDDQKLFRILVGVLATRASCDRAMALSCSGVQKQRRSHARPDATYDLCFMRDEPANGKSTSNTCHGEAEKASLCVANQLWDADH